MKIKNLLPSAFLAGGALLTGTVGAEDIDIFPSNVSASSSSNVLIVLDAGANWGSQVGDTWSSNVDLGNGNTCGTGGAYFCYAKSALVSVLSGLSGAKNLNIGVMLTSANGGGYVRFAVRDINQVNAAAGGVKNGDVLMTLLKSLTDKTLTNVGGGGSGSCTDKTNNTDMSWMLDEAYRYFTGMKPVKAGNLATNLGSCKVDARDAGSVDYITYLLDGKTQGNPPVATIAMGDRGAYTDDHATRYGGTPASSGCGKNYLLYIGNGVSSSSSERAASEDATANFRGYRALPNPASSGYFGDSFAKFMNSGDAEVKVKTYTIDIAPKTNGQGPDNTNLLKNMALLGGGTYSAANSSDDLVNQIKAIFNQIQASDAAFAAVSLPVSVNVRGSYLNQVYMGQFRPGNSPRWFGNLKLYQLAPDANGNVFMVDRTGTTPVESQTTGFIVDEALSFWTKPSSFWNFRCTDATGAALPYDRDTALLCGNPISGSDSPDGSVVEKGAAAQRLRTAPAFSADISNSGRNLYTYNCTNPSCNAGTRLSGLPFNTTTISPASTANQTAFGTTHSVYSNANTGGSAQAGELTDLVNWVRGVDNTSPTENSGMNSPYAIGPRPSMVGDVLHSRPVVVSYNTSASGCSDQDRLDKDVVAFYGANDGLLHATLGGQAETSTIVSPNTPGTELWAFTPSEFFGKFKRLRDNVPPITFPAPVAAGPNNKPYLLDGNITTYTEDGDGDCRLTTGANPPDKAYLFLTMRRGGRFIYALDILDPLHPKFLWKRSYTDTALDSRWAELGQTWSQLTPVLLGVPPNRTLALIFGAGYDPGREDRPYADGSYGSPTVTGCASPNPCMGRGIFVVNATTGAIIRLFGAADNPRMTNSIPSDVYVIRQQNGSALQAYAGDTGGNVWKIDLMDHVTQPANPSPTADPTRWTLTQVASLGDPTDTTHTGPYARKFLYYFDAVAINGGYALLAGTGDREKPFDTTVQNRFYMLKDSSTVTGYPIRCEGDEAHCELFDATHNSTVPGSAKGWYLKLGVGEKTVGSSATVDGTTFFPTNEPSTNAANACVNPNLGIARLYGVNYLTGAPSVFGNRSTSLPGGGLPPSPIAVMTQLEQETPPSGSASGTPNPITKKLYQTVCSGPHCVPVPLTLERRNFVYWFQESLD